VSSVGNSQDIAFLPTANCQHPLRFSSHASLRGVIEMLVKEDGLVRGRNRAGGAGNGAFGVVE
jgi:hypothetical protein